MQGVKQHERKGLLRESGGSMESERNGEAHGGGGHSQKGSMRERKKERERKRKRAMNSETEMGQRTHRGEGNNHMFSSPSLPGGEECEQMQGANQALIGKSQTISFWIFGKIERTRLRGEKPKPP